jgi:hypothetical protein
MIITSRLDVRGCNDAFQVHNHQGELFDKYIAFVGGT